MNEFEEHVQVPLEELKELKQKAEEINRRIKELSAPRQIAPYVSRRPLSHPKNLKKDEPIFGFKKWVNPDVWNAFIKLAKAIHEKSPTFYMSTAHPGSLIPYIRDTGAAIPKTISQLSEEQVKISAKMLDEMIAIYNHYYVNLHRQVVYDSRDGRGPELVDVIPPIEE